MSKLLVVKNVLLIMKKSLLKWTSDRSEQAKNTSELFKFSGLKDYAITTKGLRPSKILKS